MASSTASSHIVMAQVMAGEQSDAQKRIMSLKNALQKMQTTTQEASRCSEGLVRRSQHLNDLTSPASDASAMLSQSASNLGATLVKLKDARDKFETVRDCEPAIERLHDGVKEMNEQRNKVDRNRGLSKQSRGFRGEDGGLSGNFGLSEQDVYAAADSMEILRDAFDYFLERKTWRSTPSALQGLERVHKIGVHSMCNLITNHLLSAGQAIRLKRNDRKDGGPIIPDRSETAEDARDRLTRALQNRDLLKSIGEYEEHQPVDARPIREMRAVFECLGGDGHHLGPPRKKEPSSLAAAFGVPANRVIRTEKVGSGGYTSLVKKNLKTGFAQLDAYGEARREVAFKAIDGYYRRTKAERKKNAAQNTGSSFGDKRDEADTAARDAVRCLEHAMVVVAGEKNVYRSIVAPSLVLTDDEDAPKISPFYRKACVAAYSHVVACVVDRTMDIIETVFLKEGGIGVSSSADKDGEKAKSGLSVRFAASAAAAGLRMLDGVRMLGPSLAKLCDMPIDDGSEMVKKNSASNMSVASTLCIAIHRTTVKNTAKTLENLAKAIQEDPVNGSKHRPPDARIASVSSNVVRAIRLISPFMSAYKSVTKRRALPWDPNIGDEAGEMDAYVRFLVMRLLNSLQGKALNYTKDDDDDGGQAKSNMFMINNTFYLLQQLATPTSSELKREDSEHYQLDGRWFEDKVNAIFESENGKYLAHWENINSHLTSVDSSGLEYQKNKNLLSLESGRLFKDRFKGFIEEFELMYEIHNRLSVIDPGLRRDLQAKVKKVFLHRYEKFWEKYSRFRFSKKNQAEYLKYPPEKVDSMISLMYGGDNVGDA